MEKVIRSARMIKECAQRLGMTPKEFRSKLFNRTLKVKSSEHRQFIFDCLPHIREVQKMETSLINKYRNLVYKLAYSVYTKLNRSKAYDVEDYFQQGQMALVDAIYSYTDDENEFMTFAWHVILNKLISYANESNPLSRLGNKAAKLLRQFYRQRGQGQGFNDNEVIANMCISEEDESLLRRALITSIDQTSLESRLKAERQAERHDDYTSARSGVRNEKDTVPCHFEIREAIENAGLSDIERKVIDASMMPYYGWKEDIASQNINPRTGKRFTRAAIKWIVASAHRKIKNAYLGKKSKKKAS